MTRWKQDATEFVVSVCHNAQHGSSATYVPKPIIARLGTPDRLKFVIQDDKILLSRP